MIDWLNDNQGFASVVLAFALLVVSASLAVITYRSGRASERRQFGAEIVIVGGGIMNRETFMYSISNIGSGPAYRLRGKLTVGNRAWYSPSDQDITFLAGTSVPVFVGGMTHHSLHFVVPAGTFPSDRLPAGSVITCTYEDRFGKHTAELRPYYAAHDQEG